jgi:glycosyltransferase involved in cell wall biosynthesis
VPAPDSPYILAVSSEVPWPLDSGGHLRSYHLINALARRFPVTLVAGSTPALNSGEAPFGAMSLRRVPLPPRTFLGEARRAATALRLSEPYVCFRRHARREMRAAVEFEIARQPPAALYLDHLDSVLFADLAPGIPRIIDLHNVYSSLVRRTAEEASGWRRYYLRRESELLARMEERAARLGDLLFAVSDQDRKYFEQIGGVVRVVPNGIDCAAYAHLPSGREGSEPLILFVGTLSWGPNASAAQFLIRTLLPQVRAAVPGAGLRIIGRNPPNHLIKLGIQHGVEIRGDADDIQPHLREACVVAVPLESGGGSRLKILEAFAAGIPVASTPIGSEGLEVSSGEHLLIAPRDHLANAVVQLLQNKSLGSALSTRARELVRRRYDWTSIGQMSSDLVDDVIDSHRLQGAVARRQQS